MFKTTLTEKFFMKNFLHPEFYLKRSIAFYFFLSELLDTNYNADLKYPDKMSRIEYYDGHFSKIGLTIGKDWEKNA